LEELGLEKKKNIPYPVYISSTVLNKGLDRYFAYNVEEEKKIFLQKPFTVDNLEEDINELFGKIKELEGEKENQTKIITQKDIEITNLKTEKEESMKESAKLGGS
jgi:hypothetical protein